MNAAVVIQRELRAESRRPAGYWLRVLAAGAVIVVFTGSVLTTQVQQAFLGVTLFRTLYRTLIVGAWVFVPLMTADGVSRERREGTLGLLFLTPLTPRDVILGKSAVHILRAATLFAAALPVLGLPFVLGGVTWQLALSAAFDVCGTVLLAIGAGLYASIHGGSVIQVMVRAEIYGWLVALFCMVYHVPGSALFYVLGRRAGWAVLPVILVLFAFDLAVFIGLLEWASNKLRKNWQDESPTPEQPAWVKDFSKSDLAHTMFRWEKGRTMDRNPMAWLQEYSWTARLTKWGWFLGLIAVEFIVLSSGDSSFRGRQTVIAASLALGIAFSAAGSFRRERQSGLLELILVTPLTVNQLIGGRLWGIFCHYAPAFAVLAFGWKGERMLDPRSYSGPVDWLFLSPIPFACLGVLGLWLSLTRVPFLLALIITWLMAFLVPVVLSGAAMDSFGMSFPSAMILGSSFALAVAVVSFVLLRRSLVERSFLRAEGN